MECIICYEIFLTRTHVIKHMRKVHLQHNDLKKIKEQLITVKKEAKRLSDENANLNGINTKLLHDNEQITNEIEKLKDENESLKSELITILKQNCDSNKSVAEKIIENNTIMAKAQVASNNTALSTIQFLTKYFADAPCIEKTTSSIMTDMIIYHDKGIKYGNQQSIDTNLTQEQKDEQVALILIKKFKADKLERFITKGILWYYKKEDPKEQSLWSTDTSRMIFLVKIPVDVGKNLISKWITDKNGDELRNYVIDPIIENMKNIFSNYHQICLEQLKDKNISVAKSNKIRKNQEDLGKMLYVVTDKNFPKTLLAGLISEFDIKKNPKIDLKQITDGKS